MDQRHVKGVGFVRSINLNNVWVTLNELKGAWVSKENDTGTTLSVLGYPMPELSILVAAVIIRVC